MTARFWSSCDQKPALIRNLSWFVVAGDHWVGRIAEPAPTHPQSRRSHGAGGRPRETRASHALNPRRGELGDGGLHRLEGLRDQPSGLGSRRVKRLLAWLVTGPIGFFVAGVLDWLALVVYVVRARLSGREP